MIYAVTFLLSVMLTWIIRAYARKKAILDIPNARSSHSTPTPHGGGLAIMAAFFTALFLMYESFEPRLLLALACVIPLIVVSWLDDLYTITSRIRLGVQLLCAAAAVAALGGINSIDLIFIELHGFWLNLFALLAIIWLTNLYNFLDGIDGYAAAEAVIVALAAFVLLSNESAALLAAGTAGFLLFNWQRASIFMGDVGSAPLGFIFGVLCFYDTSGGNIYVWLTMLSLFWFDATVTLLRRWRKSENIFHAHRSHAYQRLVQHGWPHANVVLASLAINMLFALLLFLLKPVYYPYLFIAVLVSLSGIMRKIDKLKAMP